MVWTTRSLLPRPTGCTRTFCTKAFPQPTGHTFCSRAKSKPFTKWVCSMSPPKNLDSWINCLLFSAADLSLQNEKYRIRTILAGWQVWAPEQGQNQEEFTWWLACWGTIPWHSRLSSRAHSPVVSCGAYQLGFLIIFVHTISPLFSTVPVFLC